MNNQDVSSFMRSEILKEIGISKSAFFNLSYDCQRLIIDAFLKKKMAKEEKKKVLSLFKK